MADDYQAALSDADLQTFGNLITKTKTCLGSPQRTSHDGLECETAYLSNNDLFTYHTHPNGTPYPSETDKKTTNRLNKQYMFIGLVPTREVVVYSKKDNFSKMIGRFKV